MQFYSIMTERRKEAASLDPQLLERLRQITPEEQRILEGDQNVDRKLYTSARNFVIDSRKLLARGKLIEVRPHTRFIHFPRHSHNYVEMVYMCSGTTTHIINGTKKLVLAQGDLLLLNQNATQEILPAGKEDIAVNFIILPEFFEQAMHMLESGSILYNFILSTLTADSTDSSYLYFHIQDALPVQNLIENMIWTLLRKNPAPNTINQISMGLLFLNLTSFADTIDREGEGQYEQHLVFLALQYLDNHYRTGTLEDFSASVHMQPYTVSRLLKKHTSMNFKELLMERRLRQAAYLLSNTSFSTEAVLHAIGYENSSFFYRKFKEKYGKTPKVFRRISEKE